MSRNFKEVVIIRITITDREQRAYQAQNKGKAALYPIRTVLNINVSNFHRKHAFH